MPTASLQHCGDTNNNHGINPRISWLGLGLVFITPALGGFLYGYDIGATSFVLAMLRRRINNNDDSLDTLLVDSDYDDDDSNIQDLSRIPSTTTFHDASTVWWDTFGIDDDSNQKNNNNSGLQEGLFVSAISLGALVGSHLVLFHLAATIGRRMELRVAALACILGTLCNILSGTSLATSNLGWPLLLLGRTLFGFGIGFVMHGAPNYMAEMAPSSIRGAIVSAKESLIVLGIVVGYAFGNYFYSNKNDDNDQGREDWAVLYQVSLLFSLPMLGLTFLVPRSTRWLLQQHLQQQELQQIPYSCSVPLSTTACSEDELSRQRQNSFRQEAKESMQFVYRDDVTMEFEHMVHQTMTTQLRKMQSTPAASGDDCCGILGNLFTDPSIASSLVVALGLLCFQEGSGQPAVLSYATVIFEQAGWGGNASVITASLMLFVSIITVFLVDFVGRKRLLQICAAIMGTALLILSVEASSITNSAAPEWQRILVLISLFVYISGYQLGFGPITWLVVAEVFPSHVRGQASALAVEFKYILNFVVQFGVPIFQRRFGWRCTFGSFGFLMAVAAIYFIPNFVQETKGLSLEQIEAKTRTRTTTNNRHCEEFTTTTDSDRTTLVGSLYDDDDEPFDENSTSSLVSDQSPVFTSSEEAQLMASELSSFCPHRQPRSYDSISV
ncbi:hypothetical protein ACA910_000575 [Epithemia clementina (nom. ined.)]